LSSGTGISKVVFTMFLHVYCGNSIPICGNELLPAVRPGPNDRQWIDVVKPSTGTSVLSDASREPGGSGCRMGVQIEENGVPEEPVGRRVIQNN